MDEPTYNGLSYRLCTEPANSLSDQTIEAFQRGAVKAARRGFNNPNIPESDIYLHAFKTRATIFAFKDDEVVGFSSYDQIQDLEEPVIYLQGSVIDPAAKGKGVYHAFNIMRIASALDELGVESAIVGTRTQSPIVLRNMVRRLALNPSLTNGGPDEATSKIARDLTQIIYDEHSDFQRPGGMEFDDATLVQKMAYGIMEDNEPKGFSMYGKQIPWVDGDEAVNAYLKRHVDFENGDAVIAIGRVDRIRLDCLARDVDFSLEDIK